MQATIAPPTTEDANVPHVFKGSFGSLSRRNQAIPVPPVRTAAPAPKVDEEEEEEGEKIDL